MAKTKKPTSTKPVRQPALKKPGSGSSGKKVSLDLTKHLMSEKGKKTNEKRTAISQEVIKRALEAKAKKSKTKDFTKEESKLAKATKAHEAPAGKAKEHKTSKAEKEASSKKEKEKAPITPPTKRHRMKSPAELSSGSKAAQELEAAAQEAKSRAEDDASGVSGFLEELNEKYGENIDLGALLKAARPSLFKKDKGKEDKTKVKKGKAAESEPEEAHEEDDEEEEDGSEQEEEAEAEASGDDESESKKDEAEEEEDSEGSGDDEEDQNAEESQEDESGEGEGEEDEDEDCERSEDEKSKGTPAALEGASDVLSQAAEKTEEKTKQIRNSTTHKPQWDKFDSQIKNRKLFPSSLAPMLRKKTRVILYVA